MTSHFSNSSLQSLLHIILKSHLYFCVILIHLPPSLSFSLHPSSYPSLSLLLSGDIASKTGKDSQNYTVSGGFEQLDEQTLVINELPVGRWTTDYKQVRKEKTK